MTSVLPLAVIALAAVAGRARAAQDVEFTSARCGIAFRHPDGWDVVRDSLGGTARCAFKLRPKDLQRRLRVPDRVDVYTIGIDVRPRGFESGLRASGFKREKGVWYPLGRMGTKGDSASAVAGEGWRGLRGIAPMGCYGERGYAGICENPVAFIGTSRRSARIEAGPQSEDTFDKLLRTFRFTSAK